MKRRRTPWWLEAGPETCDFCLQAYRYESGYRCVDCDWPMCPACVVPVRVTRTVRCPPCHESGSGTDGSGEDG